jgi:hypothetical protein
LPEVFDLQSPFLVICADRRTEKSTPFERTNSVYLVNPTDDPLEEVRTSTGGHFTAGDDLLVAEETSASHATVDPRSFLCIETTSDDEFDELNCWWHVSFRVKGSRTVLQFGASKHLWNTRYSDDVPVLHRPGRLVPQSTA